MALLLKSQLRLERCPHCGIAHPNLDIKHNVTTSTGHHWCLYECNSCHKLVTAYAADMNRPIVDYFPATKSVNEDIPERPRTFLKQAMESSHTPTGAVMLAASAIDAMLKNKGYKDGSLHARIEKAAAEHLITEDMKLWAHDVRLDANDQRHADEEASLPTTADAERAVEFAAALAEILFVLPSRVQRGIQKAAPQTST
jgi:hypothetical protein